MRLRITDELLLWSIGVLQPVAPEEALAYLIEMYADLAEPLRSIDFVAACEELEQRGLVAVARKSGPYYSLTQAGNERLPKPLRKLRDQARLFLLREASNDRVQVSGGQSRELGDASSPENVRLPIQEDTRPVDPAAALRATPRSGRIHWPRVFKQLKLSAGPGGSPPDTFLRYYSFPSLSALKTAAGNRGDAKDMTPTELALAIGISPILLVRMTQRSRRRFYRTFSIPKAGGGNRQIDSPRIFLKVVQRWLVDYVLWQLKEHSSCHSFRRNRGIITNASVHAGKPFVLNFDIKDFFGSVGHDLVFNTLVRDGIGPRLARFVSLLATLDGALPQGAPTSPVISNAVLFELDEWAAESARREGIDYTRYADDVTLSGPSKDALLSLKEEYEARLKGMGFILNKDKTRLVSRNGRQIVTGCVVNSKVAPARTYRRKIRAMFHQAAKSPEQYIGRLRELRGHLAYLGSFESLRGTSALRDLQRNLETVDNYARHIAEAEVAKITES